MAICSNVEIVVRPGVYLPLYQKRNQRGDTVATNDSRLEPYLRAGLTVPFAQAIVNGINPEEVLGLWEQDWWKQYDPDDQLVTATLSGYLPQSDAKWLNEIRSDHGELVSKCLDGEITLEWARAIMETGFKDDPDAVEMVLDGALPIVIARLRNIEPTDIPALSPIPTEPPWLPATHISNSIYLVDRKARFVNAEKIENLFISLYGESGREPFNDHMTLTKMLKKADKEGVITGDDRSSDNSVKWRVKGGSTKHWYDAGFLLIEPDDDLKG